MINQVWKAHKTFLTDFLLSVKSNLWWHQFCLTLHCDWSRKVTQFAQPIGCKTKINDNLAHFPMLSVVSLFLFWVVIGSLGYFPFFQLTVVIILVLVLRHSINKHFQICTHWLSGRAAVKSVTCHLMMSDFFLSFFQEFSMKKNWLKIKRSWNKHSYHQIAWIPYTENQHTLSCDFPKKHFLISPPKFILLSEKCLGFFGK